MHGVADWLWAGGAVDKEVSNPALADAVADPTAIFKPALIADRWHHGALPGDRGNDAGAGCKGLYEAAVNVGLDIVAPQMRPLRTELDKIGFVGARGKVRVERIEHHGGGIAVALDPLPHLPNLY